MNDTPRYFDLSVLLNDTPIILDKYFEDGLECQLKFEAPKFVGSGWFSTNIQWSCGGCGTLQEAPFKKWAPLTMEATETKLKIGHQFLFWKKFPKRLTTMSASLGDCSVSLSLKILGFPVQAAKGLDWGDLNFCEDANEWRLGWTGIGKMMINEL